MGMEIDRVEFTDEEHRAFEDKLRRDLVALRAVLARPGFGVGPGSLGAELELHLVDAAGRPVPDNQRILARAADPRLTLEVDRFNLEVNSRPAPLAGRPFSALREDLGAALASVRAAAAPSGAEPALIGILPTLDTGDLGPGALTAGLRYQALSRAIRRLRGEPLPLRIDGPDHFELVADDVTFEGANTSFQVHLRVDPAVFARTYNAAQIAIAPALALSTNSPLFFGKRLWEETRIALFRQSVDDRGAASDDDPRPGRVSFGHGWVRQGAAELFEESVALHEPFLPVLSAEDPEAVARAGGVPSLGELRLHHGTVWRWNRAVYDPAGGGHLRIELRALPSGPTLEDLLGSAAFLVGATLALAGDADRLVTSLTFGQARRNFYEAARRGPDAELLFPEPGGRTRRIPATELALALAPRAAQALERAGVDPDEARGLIDLVVERARTRRTGARFLLREHAATDPEAPWQRRASEVMSRYLERSRSGVPVARW